MIILESAKKKVARFFELTQLLQEPNVISDQQAYKKYAKEYAALKPLAEKYNEAENIEKEIQDNEKIANGQDKELAELAKEELKELREKREKLLPELEDLLIQDDPDANKSVIFEIRAGTGGAEAGIFAADLYRMYSKYAAKMGWKTEVLGASPGESGGFKEIIFAVEGNQVYKHLKYESGVHRVQRVPVTEASGRIHTSAATVAVMPEAEEVEVHLEPKDIKIDLFRATGPGGQGVNTTDSAVRLTHLPTGMVVSCQDERSQLKNKAKAMKVLLARLLDKYKTEQHEKIAKERKTMIGTGDRSEKIRTYNFPDRRITDHRIGVTLYKIEDVLNGGIDEFVKALLEEEKKQKLSNLGKE